MISTSILIGSVTVKAAGMVFLTFATWGIIGIIPNNPISQLGKSIGEDLT